MIELKHINFAYGEKVILSDFSIEFPENKIIGILGPSGSGKTTLLNIMSGGLKHDGEMTGLDGRKSYVFQEERLLPERTVRGNLNFILKKLYPKEERSKVIDKYLQLVELDTAANLYPHELSGGMAQRVSLARAFSFPSQVIFMDEPFKALDMRLKDSIIKAFFKLWEQENRTAFFVSHDIDESILMCDVVYIFTDSPFRAVKRYDIEGSRQERKLYDPYYSKIKDDIYKVIEDLK